MRLVNEREVIQQLETVFNLRGEVKSETLQAIDACKTVDAIPVRWIQGKIGYMQCKGNPWTAESLEWLLKVWEQENEHGKG